MFPKTTKFLLLTSQEVEFLRKRFHLNRGGWYHHYLPANAYVTSGRRFSRDDRRKFHWRRSRSRSLKQSRNSAYKLVKIKNRSHKPDGIGVRRIRTFPFFPTPPTTIAVRAIFCKWGGGGEPFARKILASCPNFFKNSRKETWAIRCNNIGRNGI